MYIFGEVHFLLSAKQHAEPQQIRSIAPIAYPIAKLLDFILGTDKHHTYKKAELKTFLQFQQTGEEPLRADEFAILTSVLELNTKNVETIMTPLRVCLLFWLHF